MGRTLFISDFDDTLVTTNAQIIVTDKDGKVKKMTPAEYAVYEKQDGDQFDYSEFQDLIDPKPIPRYVRSLKRAVESPKVDKVSILTARGSEKPIVKFLKSVGINSGVKIVPLGDSNPERKKEYIRHQIQKGYDRVAFADDSPKNVEAAKELRDEFPQAKIVVHHVKPQAHTPEQPKPEQPKPEEPKLDRKQKIQKILNTRIGNPKTGNKVLVRTILGYGKDHPAYPLVMRLLQKK